MIEKRRTDRAGRLTDRIHARLCTYIKIIDTRIIVKGNTVGTPFLRETLN